jgi:hypothetical protein
MHDINNSEAFDLGMTLMINALKRKHKALVESYESSFIALFGDDCTADIMTAAVFQLAETDPDTCHWTLQNFYTLDAYLDLLESAIVVAVKTLTNQGFVIGKDFSVLPTGEILISQSAKSALMKTATNPGHIFFEAIFRVPDEAY